jgi:pimeloyl-ACP methyl ester carboxylesterase
VDVSGPVHYVNFGGPSNGPLLVFVHGLGGSWANWLALAPLLASRARVLAVDLAGHGRTLAAGRRTDVRANQRLLGAFLHEVANGPVILVGNSMGGMISLMQADANSATVAGLVLLDPALPRPSGVRPDPEIVRMFAGLMVPGVAEVTLARRRGRFSPAERVAQTLDRCTVNPHRVPPDMVAGLVAALRERDGIPGGDRAFLGAARSVVRILARPQTLTRMVQTVTQPTLLLHGTGDRLVPVQVAHDVAARRPDWRVEILEGMGHIPQIEDAPTTASTIIDWFGREGRSAAEAARRTTQGHAARSRSPSPPSPPTPHQQHQPHQHQHQHQQQPHHQQPHAPLPLRPGPAEMGRPPRGAAGAEARRG